MKNTSRTIIGAIAGDVVGSIYEFNNHRSVDFPLYSSRADFTDDTVLTVAIADCILNHKSIADTIWEYGRKYPGRGYGGRFYAWLLREDKLPYNSFGNGAAMRVSPAGFAANSIHEALDLAKRTAEVTHNHPEGIKGAQAVASAIYLAKTGESKQQIRDYIIHTFEYNLDFKLDTIRPIYEFNETCQGSVPEAIVAFLESTDFESAIRLAVSIGGDSDTIACIAGGIASAFYKNIQEDLIDFVSEKLPDAFVKILLDFDEKFNS